MEKKFLLISFILELNEDNDFKFKTMMNNLIKEIPMDEIIKSIEKSAENAGLEVYVDDENIELNLDDYYHFDDDDEDIDDEEYDDDDEEEVTN